LDALLSLGGYASEVGAEEWLFFFKDQVGGGGVWGELDPVGNAGGDVDDVSGVEDDFFSAVDSRAEGFAGTACGVVRMLVLHGALGDESYCAFRDDNLIGEELMALGVAGVNADDQQGVVVAVVFKPPDGQAGGACLGGFDQFGFLLLKVRCGVDDGVGGLS
jgi:hypothetical protein